MVPCAIHVVARKSLGHIAPIVREGVVDLPSVRRRAHLRLIDVSGVVDDKAARAYRRARRRKNDVVRARRMPRLPAPALERDLLLAGKVKRRCRLQILVDRGTLVQRHIARVALRNLHAHEVVAVAGHVVEPVRAERPVGDRLRRLRHQPPNARERSYEDADHVRAVHSRHLVIFLRRGAARTGRSAP